MKPHILILMSDQHSSHLAMAAHSVQNLIIRSDTSGLVPPS